MKDWIAILLGRLAGQGSRFQLLHWRARPADAVTENGPSTEVPVVRQTARMASAATDVPNTRIPPLPEHRPVAVLEFDGPPGPVPIMPGETVIGRHSEDDIRIRDIRISRHHARLTAGSERCEIRNLTALRSEPNPMLVNGTHRERAEVVDGDVITLGGVSFTFRKTRGSD